jgi:hypothetical protein
LYTENGLFRSEKIWVFKKTIGVSMFRTLVIILSFTIIILVCCDLLSNNDEDCIPSGAYSYIAYDSLETIIVTGWFTMEFQDSTTIEGEWHFKKIGNPENIGPQVGDGELFGQKDDSIIYIDLNPQYRDNNVLLVGEISVDEYTGEWIWSTIIGVTNKGSFRAVMD